MPSSFQNRRGRAKSTPSGSTAYSQRKSTGATPSLADAPDVRIRRKAAKRLKEIRPDLATKRHQESQKVFVPSCASLWLIRVPLVFTAKSFAGAAGHGTLVRVRRCL